MNQPSVSIIIPVYNVELYIEACIQSVMRQTYDGQIECIIVNDGSTDNSISIAKDLISKYNGPITFVVMRHDRNRGASAARNTGMDAATGEYYYFLDSDDELTVDCIERLAAPLKTERYDEVVGSFDIVYNDIPFYREQTLLIPDNTVLYGDEIVDAYRSKILPITPWNKLHSSDVVRRTGCGFKEGIIMEDVLWEFQIACSINSMCCVNQKTYIFKRRKGSVMASSGSEIKSYSRFVIFVEACRFVREKGIDSVLVQDILLDFYYHAISCYSNSRAKFVRTYRQMSFYFRPSLKKIIKGNRCCIKRCIRDIHYVLPMPIAPYWCYYINYHLHPSLSSIIKNLSVAH